MVLNQSELFPTWLLKSKVRPTRQRIDVLERSQLIARQEKNRDAIVSLIQAPAGYGKSTLLTNWTSKLAEEGVDTCWLSLNREDNETVQLIHYLCFSLFQGGVNFSDKNIRLDSFPGNQSALSLLNVLASEIESHPKDIVLILDDFENLEEPVIDELILPLINYAPDNFHIAIATRDDTKLKIADLELKGLARRLTADHLKFSLMELESFLSDLVDKDQIRQIYSLTEGWPVAVQFIRSLAQQTTDIEGILQNVRSADSPLESYLAQQIFEGLSEPLQNFLIDISLVDRISSDMANSLRGKQDSDHKFAELKKLSSLILPVDTVEQTYRLHPLFREFLLKKMESGANPHKQKLYYRTAHWYESNGDFVQAVRYYVLIERKDFAAELIRQQGSLNIWLKEGLARLKSVIKLLGQTFILTSPHLALVDCIIHIKHGDVYQARQIFDHTCSLLAKKNEENTQIDDQLDFELQVVRTLLTFYEGSRFDAQFISNLEQSLEKVPAHHHIMRGHFYTCLCGLNVDTGAFSNTANFAELAIREFEQADALYGKTYIYFHLGEMLFAQGFSKQAQEKYEQGLNLVKRYFNNDRTIKFVINVLIYELKYELNQLDEIPNSIENLHSDLEENEAWFNIYVAGYTTSILSIAKNHSKESALSAISKAYRYIEEQRLDSIKPILACLKINVLLNTEAINDAATEAEVSRLNLDAYRYDDNKYIAWREREIVACTLVRLMVLQGRTQEAINEIDYFMDGAQKSGHIHSCFKYILLRALAHKQEGNIKKALEDTHHALTLSIKSGFTRGFLDLGNKMHELLHLYIDNPTPHKNIDVTISYCKSILQCFSDQNTGLNNRSLKFSDKELEILKYLELGEANKVIARHIGISHNTVRYHLKNIFAKLDVSSRSQAVSMARKRNLIP